MRNRKKVRIKDDLSQTTNYMDKCGTDEGHLVIFDRSKEKTRDEKIFQREEICRQRKVKVWGISWDVIISACYENLGLSSSSAKNYQGMDGGVNKRENSNEL